MLAIALLSAGSLAVLGKEALPHVNDPPVHLVACVRVLGRVLDVLFIQSLMPNTVPGDCPSCSHPSSLTLTLKRSLDFSKVLPSYM